MHMSKLTTKGNRRRASQAKVMGANKRTVGSTNYTPDAKDMKGKHKDDKPQPVPARNIGKKVETKPKSKAKKKTKAKK